MADAATVIDDHDFWGYRDYGGNVLAKIAAARVVDAFVGYDFQRCDGNDAVLVITQKAEQVNAAFAELRTPDWMKDHAVAVREHRGHGGGARRHVRPRRSAPARVVGERELHALFGRAAGRAADRSRAPPAGKAWIDWHPTDLPVGANVVARYVGDVYQSFGDTDRERYGGQVVFDLGARVFLDEARHHKINLTLSNGDGTSGITSPGSPSESARRAGSRAASCP